MLGGFNLKTKLRISFLFLVFFSAIMGILAFMFMARAGEYNKLLELIQAYTVSVQNAREAEQNFIQYDRKEVQFLETGESANRTRLKLLYDTLDNITQKLYTSSLFQNAEAAQHLKQVNVYLTQYKEIFEKLAQTYQARGFYNHGLEVEMRNYIHDLQEAPSAEERVYAYMLRRNEKDFMLRNDEKYIAEFQKNIQRYRTVVKNASFAHMTPAYRVETLGKIEAYETLFLKLTQFEKELGLSENQGLKGKLKENLNAVLPILKAAHKELNTVHERFINLAYLTLLIGLILLLVIGILLSIFLSRIITRPIHILDYAITQAASGNYQRVQELEALDKRDEIGRLAINFSQLIGTIQNQFNDIEEKKQSLELTAAEDAKRNWVSEGFSSISELINLDKELGTVLEKVLIETVKYTRGNQGSIFVVQQDEQKNEFLELKACYAYDRKKYLTRTIQPGEGLVGAVWLEKELIQLTEIPENYVRITSGLGEATPSYIIILPLLYNEAVQGVVELAYFRRLEKYEMDFLKGVAERLAASINTLRVHETTQKLLEESQVMTEQLRAQEEEMRQNMEELQATQEEMERKVRESSNQMEKVIEKLTLLEGWANTQNRQLIITDQHGSVRYISKRLIQHQNIPSSEDQHLSLINILPEASVSVQPESIETIINTRKGTENVFYRCINEKIGPEMYFIFEVEYVNENTLV